LGAKVFERLVCLKDWIDADDHLQGFGLLYQEENMDGVDNQESTDTTENNTDDEFDPHGDDELWYMRRFNDLQI
jgi:hypothetical protein